MDYVLYDGECPLCSSYVAWAQLQKARPGIKLLNARETPALVRMLRSRGIEINDTIVVCLGGELLSGAEAFAFLCRPTSLRSSMLRRVLSQPVVSRMVYPALVAGRKLFLDITGRKSVK